MKHQLKIDFAQDRAQRLRQRNLVIAIIALMFGLQIGSNIWRWQSLQRVQAEIATLQKQVAGKSIPTNLNPDQIKRAVSVQSMLDDLAVPWEALFQAIEVARPPQVLVESIQPHLKDGSVSISVSSPDFDAVAMFVRALTQQIMLHHVMLTSEAWPDNGVGPLRTVIHANWDKAQ